jgi:putative hydrolase of the HAD superfamily
MIRAIIFDFGNVLAFFDHRLVSRRLSAFTDLSEPVLHSRLFASGLEHDYETGRLSTAEVIARVRSALNVRCDDSQLIAAYCEIFTPNHEIEPLLPLLKTRHRLLVGSNTTPLHSAQIQRQFPHVFRWFDHAIFSYEIGARKPAAKFFEHCVLHVDCEAAECLFIDDLAPHVQGARAFGMHAIQYCGVPSLRADLAKLGILTAKTLD